MICQPFHPSSHSYQCRTLPSPLLPWLHFGGDERHQKRGGVLAKTPLHTLPLFGWSNPFLLIILWWMWYTWSKSRMFFTKCGPLLLDWMRSTFFLSGLIPGRSGKQITPHYQQPADREPLDTRSREASFSSQKPKKKKKKNPLQGHFRHVLPNNVFKRLCGCFFFLLWTRSLQCLI